MRRSATPAAASGTSSPPSPARSAPTARPRRPQNAGFLRQDAQLAIVVLSDEDDCSAPPSTVLYSLNGGHQNLTNSLGPIANYRCNEFGHLCIDPAGDPSELIQPPETPPGGRAGDPLGADVEPDRLRIARHRRAPHAGEHARERHQGAQVRSRQPDRRRRDRRAAGALHGRLGARWAGRTQAGELWPQIEHSCGSGSDVNPRAGGDRRQLRRSGRPDHPVGAGVRRQRRRDSVCDAATPTFFGAIVNRIAAHLPSGSVTVTKSGSGDFGAGWPARGGGGHRSWRRRGSSAGRRRGHDRKRRGGWHRAARRGRRTSGSTRRLRRRRIGPSPRTARRAGSALGVLRVGSGRRRRRALTSCSNPGG